jgi:hypothetical protein
MNSEKKKFVLTRRGLVLSILGVVVGVSLAAFLSSNFNNTSTAELSQELIVKSEKIISEAATASDSLATIPEEPVAGGFENEPDSETISEYVVPTMPPSTITREVISSENITAPAAKQEIINDSSKVVAKPNPTKKNESKPAETYEPKPTTTAAPIQPTKESCYVTREEDPERYDSCRAGYVAPTFEFVGYHSCKRLTEDLFEVTGLVRMVGGNYRDFVWNQGEYSGMALVSQTLRDSDPSYPLRWFVQASFLSMNPAYEGRIAKAYGDGIVWIEENEISPNCLRK